MADHFKSTPERKQPRTMRVAPVRAVIKRLEQITNVKRRISSGYYDRPEILAEIAARLRGKI